MKTDKLPEYAVFDDYCHMQRVAVIVRWFLLVTWLFLLNYRTDVEGSGLIILNAAGVSVAAHNGYIHWRIRRGRLIT